MCGIAGQLMLDRRPVDPAVVAAMGSLLGHRGPDDEGLYVNGHVGLAHRRLSVLDLTPAGHQPMCNEDGTVWIVFNGEIYNYGELRESLKGRHAFRSRTDTEVILHLYEEYGVRCLSRLRGMFAFALWDEPAQRLVLARDRLGKKPLFYGTRNGSLIFASELKALLVAGERPDIDPIALHYYLSYQYVPAPRTIFRGIQKLRPGHVLMCEQGKISESAYWTLRFTDKRTDLSELECKEQFLGLLQESVRLRLASDVPLGAFLSGGVDSSTVVALMSQLISKPVQTFSIGFKEESHNELPYARMVAEQFKTDHHEFVVQPSAVDILPILVRVYDEPYADSSAIPTYYVSELSRKVVTVVLNGDGGDEILAGYDRYRFTGLEQMLDTMIRRSKGIKSVRGLRNRLLARLWPLKERYLYRICYFTPEDVEGLYSPEFKELIKGYDAYNLLEQWFEEAEADEFLDRLLSVDTRTYLPDDLLVKVDRATMAHGLEARSPFLDHHVVEFAASLPVQWKLRRGQGKYLLKEVMRGRLPDEILYRPKQGFAVPIDRWFREDCRDFVRDTLLSARALARGYFRPERIRELVDQHQHAGVNLGPRLYALLMLELWHREYVDGGRA